MQSKVFELLMPQINVNDTEVFLGKWQKSANEFVTEGTILAEVETSKGTEAILAPKDGYFHPLAQEQHEYKIGVRIGVLAEEADYKPKAEDVAPAVASAGAELLITAKAKKLALELGIDLNELPTGVLLKEKDVSAFAKTLEMKSVNHLELAQGFVSRLKSCQVDFDKAILIAGAGTTAKIVIDTLRAAGEYQIVGIVDGYVVPGTTIMDIPVIAADTDEVLSYFVEQGLTRICNSIASIFDLKKREDVYQRLKKAGFEMPTIVHPRAFVEPSAILGEGVFVHANAYVGSETVIGHNTFINTSAVVSHDCVIGNSVFCAPNSVIAGIVTIGDCTLVGMCTTILSRVKIGSHVILVNGSDILKDIPDNYGRR